MAEPGAGGTASWFPGLPSLEFQRGLFEVRRYADGTVEVFMRQALIPHDTFDCGACGGTLLSNFECDFLVHDDPGEDVTCTDPRWKPRERPNGGPPDAELINDGGAS